MAARLSPAHDTATREKIQTSQLINRLQGFALGELDPKTEKPQEIDTGRLKAIEILLRKSLPDLANVAITGDGNTGPARLVVEWATKQGS